MFIDILIIFMLVSIVLRARQAGLVRQLSSAVGFIAGLFIGAALQPRVMSLAGTAQSQALLSLLLTLGSALFFMQLFGTFGAIAKQRIQALQPLDKADSSLGAAAGGLTLLAAIWLVTPLLTGLPSPGLQRALSHSFIVSTLNQRLPSAPDFIARVDRIVNPNGFPDVFAGLERRPLQPDAPMPVLDAAMAQVVKDVRPSIVKIEGKGCGGIVEGSGFVAADGTIVTNAHVIAGVTDPEAIDTNGPHDVTVIHFDADLDMAVLRVSDGSKLAGKPLPIDTAKARDGAPGVVLGYPGGGGFTAGAATILDQFTAVGRDIYGADETRRSVYELKADVIPGNSGGPLVDADGEVAGLIFAQSTTYQQIGYALTTPLVAEGLQQALADNRPVGTGSCAE